MTAAHSAPVRQSTAQIGRPASTYNNAIGYLRAFLVVLVVAHHTALTYHPYAPPRPASLLTQPRLWLAFPVVDSQRWGGAPLFCGFNDVFFMSLLFFLSGLFVWNSLQRKGGAAFLHERFLRLGIPFIVSAVVLAPLAYYPTYLQIRGHDGFGDFVHQWLSLGSWSAGPAWFIWVLLVFDCIARLLFAVAPDWGETLGQFVGGVSRRPVLSCAGLVAVSAVLYVPLAIWLSPGYWSAFGPFVFQTCRILHYLAYFLIGVGVGAYGLDRGLLAPDGKLARRWPLWVLRAVAAFMAAATVTIIGLTTYPKSLGWAIAYDSLFSVSCAASCFAFLALFVRFAQSRSSFFDSLSRNSYGIYIVHYAFVSWLCYAIVPASLPGFAKFIVALAAAVALSWATTVLMRRIPAVARVV